MYIELKTHPGGHDDRGPAWIGRVYFNKSGKTLTYKGQRFQRGNWGTCSNYVDVKTGDKYWISGPKKNGEDRYPWARRTPVYIDADVLVEYWTKIRNGFKRDRSKLYMNTY
ncbi:MAG: hypothetical protein JSU58_09505 [Dehalococcoidales bacterium]|nr:MAG: hypothetical protein JSU58_09505 [Dehalococcoidales bacterium]